MNMNKHSPQVTPDSPDPTGCQSYAVVDLDGVQGFHGKWWNPSFKDKLVLKNLFDLVQRHPTCNAEKQRTFEIVSTTYLPRLVDRLWTEGSHSTNLSYSNPLHVHDSNHTHPLTSWQ